jgi:hypothetical protein
MFSAKRQFQPYVEPEIVQEADDNSVIIRPTKRNKYLPGERLLMRLNKDKKTAEAKMEDKKIDIDRIANSLSRILGEF